MLSIPTSILMANAYYFSGHARIPYSKIRDCSNEFMIELCNRKILFLCHDDTGGSFIHIEDFGEFIRLGTDLVISRFDADRYTTYLEQVFYDRPDVLDALYVAGERWGKKVKL